MSNHDSVDILKNKISEIKLKIEYCIKDKSEREGEYK